MEKSWKLFGFLGSPLTVILWRWIARAMVLGIEEVWRKKPRQTVVVVFWGKIAAHMASFDCIADKLIKGGQGQKSGGIFVYNIFYYTSNVLRHSGKYCNPIVWCVLSLLCVCTVHCILGWSDFFYIWQKTALNQRSGMILEVQIQIFGPHWCTHRKVFIFQKFQGA